MSDSAFQIQYRQEFVAAFEQHQSLLRETVTTEAVIKGNQAVFLVAGSGTAVAVSRGINGRIPARGDDLTQNTCTLQEWHDLVRKTGFNVFASQGNQVQALRNGSMAVLNRDIDLTILAELANATQDYPAAAATATGAPTPAPGKTTPAPASRPAVPSGAAASPGQPPAPAQAPAAEDPKKRFPPHGQPYRDASGDAE